jgi:tetratricopeptide (TPR) repeat protein
VPYFYRGAAETDLMSFGPAIADLEKAKSLEGPATPQATIEIIDVQLVQAYLAGGQPDKGLALAQQVRTHHPDNTQVSAIVVNHYVDDANSQAQAGHTAVAVADLEQAAQLDPSRAAQFYTGAANVMGNAAKTADDSKKALAEVRKALAVAPNDPSANYLAGVLAANAGDQSGAIAYLQKAKANVGDNAKLAGQIDAALKKLGPK